MPLRARLDGLSCGSVVCGGRLNSVLRKGNRTGDGPLRSAQIYGLAPPHADNDVGPLLSVALETELGEKKAPALTVSQLRTILDVVLLLRTSSIEDVLALVAWMQRRNYQASLSHSKRRETEG